MVNRQLQLQELEVFYILPALRRDLADAMKNTGRSQKEIAQLLGVTEAAVSQYMSSKRASLVKFDKELRAEVNKASAEIQCKDSMRRELQKLMSLVRKNRTVCKLHEQLEKVDAGCNACFAHETKVKL
ncbi:hypothetical protein COV18_07260 [Candidatus Woesearchaeota archaeon CG10_big_fil_rev_8_21_14_0_10_37_12]|nr:MAG: hypothetical protein COV18_07260 [Candidatus Woesearchaeota archaeon CG10_big_fil_rev_8_21_14_0_10_37_12]